MQLARRGSISPRWTSFASLASSRVASRAVRSGNDRRGRGGVPAFPLVPSGLAATTAGRFRVAVTA